MFYTGYKSELATMSILRKKYPTFIRECIDTHEGMVHTYISAIRIIAKKLNYNINLQKLRFDTSSSDWIPEDRDNELNDFLNYVEENPEILLMREL